MVLWLYNITKIIYGNGYIIIQLSHVNIILYTIRRIVILIL